MKKCLLWFGITIIAIVLLLGAGSFYVGRWLSEGDALEKADAIIVLAGQPLRTMYAADLYVKGYASTVYISRPYRGRSEQMLDTMGIYIPRQEETNRQVLIKKGVPSNRIVLFGESLHSTAEEAQAAKRLFEGKVRSLLVVTSFYHVRRTKMIFRDAFKSTKVNVVGTPYEPSPAKWWTDREIAANVILEIPKIVFYGVGGRFRE